MYVILPYTKKRAKLLKVIIKPSEKKVKKLMFMIKKAII